MLHSWRVCSLGGQKEQLWCDPMDSQTSHSECQVKLVEIMGTVNFLQA